MTAPSCNRATKFPSATTAPSDDGLPAGGETDPDLLLEAVLRRLALETPRVAARAALELRDMIERLVRAFALAYRLDFPEALAVAEWAVEQAAAGRRDKPPEDLVRPLVRRVSVEFLDRASQEALVALASVVSDFRTEGEAVVAEASRAVLPGD